MLDFVFDAGFGFERYTDYILDVPMYFVYRDGQYLDASGMSFRDFMAGKLPLLPGELPRADDWVDHVTTAFPEVRLKRFLELRGSDGGPWTRLCALPALWVGLLYDGTALDAAWDLVKDWTAEECETLRNTVPIMGLKTPFRGGDLQDIAREMLRISRAGLQARARLDSAGNDETGYLGALEEIVETGITPAEAKLEAFHGRWGGSVDPIFTEFAY
jgi:glutamate--cysteine ligase